MTQEQITYSTKPEDYQLLQCIGRGRTAQVWRAIYKPRNEYVAIKKIDMENTESNSDLNLNNIRQELEVWKLSQHPNILPYYGSYLEGSDICLIMKLMTAGSLQDIVKYCFPNGIKDEVLIATILKNLLQAINYLHETGKIHRDIKTSNVLCSENGEIFLGDFGVSALLFTDGSTVSLRQTLTGTPCYMAPEVILQVKQGGGYGRKADIWSFGITALELAHGKPPFHQSEFMKILVKIATSPPPKLDPNFSKKFRSMINKCLTKKSKKRLSASELLKHRFFKQAKDNNYILDKFLSTLPPFTKRIEEFENQKKLTIQNLRKIDKDAKEQNTKGKWTFTEDNQWDEVVFQNEILDQQKKKRSSRNKQGRSKKVKIRKKKSTRGDPSKPTKTKKKKKKKKKRKNRKNRKNRKKEKKNPAQSKKIKKKPVRVVSNKQRKFKIESSSAEEEEEKENDQKEDKKKKQIVKGTRKFIVEDASEKKEKKSKEVESSQPHSESSSPNTDETTSSEESSSSESEFESSSESSDTDSEKK